MISCFLSSFFFSRSAPVPSSVLCKLFYLYQPFHFYFSRIYWRRKRAALAYHGVSSAYWPCFWSGPCSATCWQFSHQQRVVRSSGGRDADTILEYIPRFYHASYMHKHQNKKSPWVSPFDFHKTIASAHRPGSVLPRSQWRAQHRVMNAGSSGPRSSDESPAHSHTIAKSMNKYIENTYTRIYTHIHT
jgi:hypothetical protein